MSWQAQRDVLVLGHNARASTVAHTADLLRFLARSRHLLPAQQAAILAGVADKLRSVEVALTHGEDERLARAVLSIVARNAFDRAMFERWLAGLAPPRPAAPPTPASIAGGRTGGT